MSEKHQRETNSSPSPITWHKTKPWSDFGTRIIIYLFGGLILFTSLVSIAGAVVATGTVTVENRYLPVQHREGGIVRHILVKDGDQVQAGDVLIELDGTSIRASADVVAKRVVDLELQNARLIAERDDLSDLEIPAQLDLNAPQSQKSLRHQRALFLTRKRSRDGEVSVLTERVGQLEREIAGHNAQLTARDEEFNINADEFNKIRPLVEKGYVSQRRVAALRRETARLEGERGRLRAQVAQLEGVISETKLRIAQLYKEFGRQIAVEMQAVSARLAEQKEALKAQQDILARLSIRAPRDGIIHALRINTPGAVITPASLIAQIIPSQEMLYVEALVRPRDISKVQQGLEANIAFTAFNTRTTPRIKGSVTKVSAAELHNRQGATYYTAKIEFERAELEKNNLENRLLPGMPADVFIETTPRSILSYFLRPLTDAMNLAMRED